MYLFYSDLASNIYRDRLMDKNARRPFGVFNEERYAGAATIKKLVEWQLEKGQSIYRCALSYVSGSYFPSDVLLTCQNKARTEKRNANGNQQGTVSIAVFLSLVICLKSYLISSSLLHPLTLQPLFYLVFSFNWLSRALFIKTPPSKRLNLSIDDLSQQDRTRQTRLGKPRLRLRIFSNITTQSKNHSYQSRTMFVC